ITSLGVVINNDDVLATPDPENIIFDYQLIYDVAQNLSWRINQSYDIEHGELAKGRYFGSKGEHDAADYIAFQMGYFGLIDLNYSALSYRQQIDNSETLQIRYKKLSVYNHSSHQSKFIDECYIGTEWKLLKELRDFNHTWQNVEIEYLGPLFSIFNPYYNNFCNHSFNFSFFNDLIDNESRQEEGNFSDYLVGLFENYYNFTFDDILEHPENATQLPWYNQTEYYFGKNNYALISENPKFHPNMSVFPRIDTIEENINNILQNLGYEGHYEVNEMQILWQLAKQVWQRLILLWCQIHRCEAVILYDLDPVCFDTLSEKNKFPIPVININGTLGEEINNSREDFTINFTIDQYWDDSVESYNVVGQINGTNSNRNIIIDCLYDSVWCQGTSDSAIGCGMVLSLAEKMKDLERLGIHPKYNVRFILFGGEETGALGAKYYAHNEDHDIDSVIDLNQLGFDQRDPEVPLIMNVASNKFFMTPILQHITDITQYEERTNDNTQVRVSWTPLGSVSDENPFGRLGSTRPLCKTIMFLKDMNWTRHHRDGANHTDGDSMDYYDEDEVRLTMEMIWNVTRFLAYNPDTWFVKDSVEYSFTDDENDENTDPDTVTVSFDIDTSFPEDKATVKVILVPRYISNLLHPAYPILYRYRAEKDFIVTPEGVTGEITLQLPKGAPAADYRVNVVLLDSRGEVFSSFLGEDGLLTQTVDSIQDFCELLENFFDDDCEEQLLQYSDEIYEDYHINIAEFLDKYPHLQDVQNLIQDLFSIYCFSDDREHTCARLSPPNDPPAQPDKPTGPIIVAPHETASYTTTTTDPNGDSVQYKWRFQFGDLFQFNRWSNILSSGTEHTKSHTWGDLYMPHWVAVKARDCQEDQWTSTNVQSDYSDKLWVFVNPGGWFDAPQETLVGETMEYQAQVEGIQPEQYLWNFGESETWEQTRETTIEKTYEENGTYLVQLKIIDDEQHEYLYSKNIDVQYLISQFNSSSGKIDQPLWFNDSSRKCNGINITNRTWDFDDGTIVYDTQNVSHIFQSPGIYNVTLTVVDEDNECIDSASTIIYIEDHPPVVQSISCDPFIIAPDHEITFYADITDGTSGIHTATLNISRPDGTWDVLPMQPVEEGPYDFDSNYTVLYTDTEHIGEYYYSIYVEDNAGNNVSHGGFSFTVSELAFLPTTPYYGTVPYDDIPVDLFSSTDASQHYAFTSIAGDVVLWMPMDETTTEYNLMDVSGYENDGVCHGGANQTENGSFGKGFLFDGVDDYLEIEPNASIMFNASQPLTWSFWIRPEYSTVNTTMGLLSKASSASNGSGFSFCLNTTTNDAAFVICAPDDGVMRYSDSVDLNIYNTSWVQLTVVYNGSLGWDVYLNGSKQDTLFFPIASNTDASYLLGAGRNATSDAADLFFQGILDDFVMFKRGVDTDEIHSLFNASEYPYSHNFTDLPDGTYDFTGCAGYPGGFANTTETRSILIDTLAPIISNVTESPDTVGFGGNVKINATVVENGSGLLLVAVNVSYPNATSWNYSMTCVGDDVYQLNFSDTWFVGQYNYSVWAMDNIGNTVCDSGRSFNVTANATISIATLKNSYSGTQYINITDPPNPPENLTLIGRGLSWNTYYNATSGENLLETYQGPVNYQEDNETWMPINNTITQLPSNHPA
ncbi:MAG TPA: PKD domain-containing protein, partial [Candidatus Thermoplasmatota archaeon]|nr:PKD domain-containing protein [Candidatus Thermoplasmatota archaeon]